MTDHDPTFITQPRVGLEEFVADDVNDLEALVSGVTQTSQSTLLLKKRKEMVQVDDALELAKQKYNQLMEVCEKRQQLFEQKQEKLRQSVVHFAPYIQDNDAKRERAEERARSETKQIELNEKRIQELRAQLQELQKEKTKLEQGLAKLRKYEQFLERIVDDQGTETYPEILDVLNRYKTLRDAYRDLKQLVQDKNTEVDHKRNEIAQLMRDTQNRVLVQNSEIHKHQKALEALRSEWFQHDIRKEQHDRLLKERIRESGQVAMSIRNLYQRCLASTSLKSKGKALTEKSMPGPEYFVRSLSHIRDRLLDLQDIHTGYSEYKAMQATGAAEDAATGAPGPRTRRGLTAGARVGPAVERGAGEVSASYSASVPLASTSADGTSAFVSAGASGDALPSSRGSSHSQASAAAPAPARAVRPRAPGSAAASGRAEKRPGRALAQRG